MKSLCLILLLAISATPACSRFTSSGRQDRAYAAHFKKLRVDREQRLARLHYNVGKPPPLEAQTPSEPREIFSEGPQAVTSGSDNQ